MGTNGIQNPLRDTGAVLYPWIVKNTTEYLIFHSSTYMHITVNQI